MLTALIVLNSHQRKQNENCNLIIASSSTIAMPVPTEMKIISAILENTCLEAIEEGNQKDLSGLRMVIDKLQPVLQDLPPKSSLAVRLPLAKSMLLLKQKDTPPDGWEKMAHFVHEAYSSLRDINPSNDVLDQDNEQSRDESMMEALTVCLCRMIVSVGRNKEYSAEDFLQFLDQVTAAKDDKPFVGVDVQDVVNKFKAAMIVDDMLNHKAKLPMDLTERMKGHKLKQIIRNWSACLLKPLTVEESIEAVTLVAATTTATANEDAAREVANTNTTPPTRKRTHDNAVPSSESSTIDTSGVKERTNKCLWSPLENEEVKKHLSSIGFEKKRVKEIMHHWQGKKSQAQVETKRKNLLKLMRLQRKKTKLENSA